MKSAVTFTSRTSGLWPRFITKVIAGWILLYFLTIFSLSVLGSFIDLGYLLALALIVITVVPIWFLWTEFPYKWDNTVTIDFETELLLISSKRNTSQQLSVVDFEGKRVPFSEIEYYLIKNYESIIFSPYCLVSIYSGGKNVNLVSIKDPINFSDLISILNNEIGVKPK